MQKFSANQLVTDYSLNLADLKISFKNLISKQLQISFHIEFQISSR